MYKQILFPIAFLLIACMPVKKKRVIFFGDSITQQGADPGGYITLVEDQCKAEHREKQYDFIGSGISGNKVYDLYLRLENDVLSKKPDVVLIFIGVNDVWHKQLLGTGTDADKFGLFYQSIINKLLTQKIRVVLCTPAVIGEKYDRSNEQDAEMDRYSDIIRLLATKNNLPLVDLREKFISYSRANNPNNDSKGILTTDGVHLNEKGNGLVAAEMWKAIKSL
jgi:lysophospholipase L1-like esterase